MEEDVVLGEGSNRHWGREAARAAGYWGRGMEEGAAREEKGPRALVYGLDVALGQRFHL